ncbi:short-chain dehydrogenase/reductase [Kaistia sp. 32K]|uniref:SDR family oxidoreductase n=1 Tax=Kaistia sp. 32K TaxID=2795690 RepID=UPI0019165303|nr:SDR family oxidoreductase [Kaistia sp. 32K]BCP54628.1 short-chain dehydrogenase/reductase [Kaistia sp. 32K]
MKQTVLVTGASSGIGQAAVRLFAGKGWNVVATMRNPERDADFAGLDDVLVARLDVEDQASIQSAIAAGIERFGRIDALVNNAGYGQYGLFEALPREVIQRQFDVNVFGVMDVTRAVLPHFRANRSGVVLNVSSGAGLFTLPLISLYCASKFALEGFSEALSYELASQNITVKLVIPHGGVAATRFSERSAEDFVTDPALADYDDFVARSNAAFAQMGSARTMTSADVAEVIFGAVTDGTDRLRYLVGDDARGFVKARRTLDDADYVEFMRSHFRKQTPAQ